MTPQAEELRAGRTIIVNTVGTSMQPLLYENDTQVVVEPVRRPLKKGDMVLYENTVGDTVIHRVIGLSDSAAAIRGDNTYVTESVPCERISGLVTEVYRHGRHYHTQGWQMRLYAKFIIGVFPLRKGYRAFKRKCRTVYHL